MNQEPKEALEDGLRELGIACTPAQQQKLFAYAQFVLAENLRANLTGARSLSTFIREHVLDSLTAVGIVELGRQAIDLGSGAGLPGVPLAILRPDTQFVLIEPRARRVAILERLSKTLRLHNITVIKSSAFGPRAEPWLGKADTVLVRALAKPARALGLGAAFLRSGGRLVFFAGRSAGPKGGEKKSAVAAGLAQVDVKRVRVPGIAGGRYIWVLTKNEMFHGKQQSPARSTK